MLDDEVFGGVGGGGVVVVFMVLIDFTTFGDTVAAAVMVVGRPCFSIIVSVESLCVMDSKTGSLVVPRCLVS